VEIKTEPLLAHLAAKVEVHSPLSIELISGGRSNLTFAITDSTGQQWVLRKPPAGATEKNTHNVGREFRILAALHRAGVPVPEPIFFGDAGVLTETPAFVMSHVGGVTLDSPGNADRLDASAKQRLASQMIKELAALHRLDPGQIGLGELVRDKGLIERQLRRWGQQLDHYPKVTSGLIWDVAELLEAGIPVPQRTSIVHGDFKLGNLRVSDQGELLSILDWELALTGDPLMDLGWLLASWSLPGDPNTWIVAPPTQSPGFPDKEWLASEYGQVSGLDIRQLDYYVAFALWRWSCINEGHLARFSAGVMGQKTIDRDAVSEQIKWQLKEAARLLSGPSLNTARSV
jgi:aminoglycoside phosphotransferase (APT) family kinase protein